MRNHPFLSSPSFLWDLGPCGWNETQSTGNGFIWKNTHTFPQANSDHAYSNLWIRTYYYMNRFKIAQVKIMRLVGFYFCSWKSFMLIPLVRLPWFPTFSFLNQIAGVKAVDTSDLIIRSQNSSWRHIIVNLFPCCSLPSSAAHFNNPVHSSSAHQWLGAGWTSHTHYASLSDIFSAWLGSFADKSFGQHQPFTPWQRRLLKPDWMQMAC